jgi:hypothetical protein
MSSGKRRAGVVDFEKKFLTEGELLFNLQYNYLNCFELYGRNPENRNW